MKINNIRPMNMNPYNKQIDKLDKMQAPKRKDQLEISTEAMQLQQGGNQIEIERQQKVNELKSKVESGEYKVNPEEVARKIYSFWNNE
ncbi:flagellar biosynthesis anti-sigma factor FlgM [Cytobacillus sp. FJAT-53684]|uniref:Negative regulator of flagellin synthesis n=1 Tax=Cytobacillus mangrovibacter TaxID=3299024 RepID=A0ABW6JX74_9BACI